MRTVIYVRWLPMYHTGESMCSLDGIELTRYLMWWPSSQIMQGEYDAMPWYENASIYRVMRRVG